MNDTRRTQTKSSSISNKRRISEWNKRKFVIRLFYGISFLTGLSTMLYLSLENTLKRLIPPPVPTKVYKNCELGLCVMMI
jgi:hypothetical protein